MNNLDKIKLTISARDSHGQYGMYREVEDREKYLSIKITERAKNLLNTSDINACALDCRIHYKNDDTKVTLSTLVDVEDSTTRKEVLERIIKALDERYKAQEIKEIEIYRMIWSSISDSTKRVIDLFENDDMKDEKYIVIEYL